MVNVEMEFLAVELSQVMYLKKIILAPIINFSVGVPSKIFHGKSITKSAQPTQFELLP